MAPRPTADLRRPGLLLATALVLGAGCAAGGDEPSPAPSTSTEASTTSRPSPEAERRSVLIMGDSVLAEAAAPLIHALEATGAAEARFALGPVLPRSESDEVVWQAALDDTDPEVIVVSVGHWEYLQVLGDFAVGERLEPGIYAAEVLEPFVDLMTADGARLLWVGPAVIEDPDEAEFVTALERDYRALAGRRDEVDFVDADTWVAPDGFTSVLPGPDGTPVPARRADGIHLCPEAQVLLADGLLQELAPTLRLTPGAGWIDSWRDIRPDEAGGCAADYQG